MRVQITVDRDGKITLITQNGTFTAGVDKINEILAALSAEGIDIQQVNPPEQHRHDDPQHNHLHQEDRNALS
jgi:hypothetical protein